MKDPDAPATFRQRVAIAGILRAAGVKVENLRFEMTKAEASAYISKAKGGSSSKGAPTVPAENVKATLDKVLAR
jgi:hypothetical protein